MHVERNVWQSLVDAFIDMPVAFHQLSTWMRRGTAAERPRGAREGVREIV